MQQYSSLPEFNSQVDSKPKLLTKNQQLRAELWLERSLNRLQTRLSNYLVSVLSKNQQIVVTEADICQIVVDELQSALNTCQVAIALLNPQQPICQICYFTCSSSTDYTDSPPPFIARREKKSTNLDFKKEITAEDLQLLPNSEPYGSWHLTDQTGNIIGWLILDTAPIPSSYQSLKTSQLMVRAAQQCSTAIAQIKGIKSLQENCQQLEHKNQELERTNQLKNQFLANTSHEIRTPLSSILGFTHLLLAQGYEPSRERHQEYLNRILSSGKHLLALINDILDLSKIEANQLDMQWEEIDVPNVCKNVLAMVKEKAANKGLKLVLDIDPDVSTLVADSLRLKQMLLNLLFNAVKFTTSGSVGLEVKSSNFHIDFTVWDTGIGISQEHQAELFQPYFQITNNVVNCNEGTGLGLAVTQKLAELHGGWVEVKSEMAIGSRFTITIPIHPIQEFIADGEVKKDQENLNSTSEDKLDKSTPCCSDILLVEDDLPNAQLMQIYLQKLGYRITWVKSAPEMWEVLKDLQPAVILLDVHLQKQNSLVLVEQLREHQNFKNIPIIAQTAMAMKGDRETCLAAGVNDYISKPIDLPLLAALISKYSQTGKKD